MTRMKQEMTPSFLKNKKIFVFDWDGTVFDSMNIKLETFSTVLTHMIANQIPDTDLKQKIKTGYQKLSGRPRKNIFNSVLENFSLARDAVDYADFNARLMLANKRHLEKAAIYDDAEKTLKTLIGGKKMVFISSSVPQEELDFFTSGKLSSDIMAGLSGILGSRDGFSKGTGHIQFIQRNTGCDKGSMIFIGDDLADYHLSAAAGVDFILVDREERFKYPDIETISSLTEIGDMVNP